jgi:ferrochelatase
MSIKNAAKNAPKTAIAMMNMGGPATLNEVQSFLTNLFTDPEIIPLGKVQDILGPLIAKRRTPSIQDQYAQIGGGSPILKWTNIQGEAMCKLLDEMRPEVSYNS